MLMLIFRFSIVLSGALLGFFMGKGYLPSMEGAVLGMGIGCVAGLLFIYTVQKVLEFNLKTLVGALTGLTMGLVLSYLIIDIAEIRFPLAGARTLFNIFVALCFGYLGGILGVRVAESVELPRVGRDKLPLGWGGNNKILDTSAIIDGRIADIVDTCFLEGTLIIPQFVLKELQHIADSHDPIRRSRGRRGLDVLKGLQENGTVRVKISSQDFPKIQEVDEKLIALAKRMKAKIITTDYNLNQVAKLQEIEVLNVNELSGALRPVVLPGEEMDVFILRQGKEPQQGVGYLDDGTMIVVENGKGYTGKKVKIEVTSLLQTPSGRMIFGRVREEAKERGEREGLPKEREK
jgi:uncharacterized protein YacL